LRKLADDEGFPLRYLVVEPGVTVVGIASEVMLGTGLTRVELGVVADGGVVVVPFDQFVPGIALGIVASGCQFPVAGTGLGIPTPSPVVPFGGETVGA
jgi:hypothetical protein